jgi:hypothetical protein
MTPNQKRLHEKINWLRPYTRSAASFSMATAGWLPMSIRNFPLKVIKKIIARYQSDIDSGCKSC